MALASSEIEWFVQKLSELSGTGFIPEEYFCSVFIKNKYEVHKQNESEEAVWLGKMTENYFSISNSLVLQDTNEMAHPFTGIYFSTSDPKDQSSQPHPLVMPLFGHYFDNDTLFFQMLENLLTWLRFHIHTKALVENIPEEEMQDYGWGIFRACMSRDNSYGFNSTNSVPSESIMFLTAPTVCSAVVCAQQVQTRQCWASSILKEVMRSELCSGVYSHLGNALFLTLWQKLLPTQMIHRAKIAKKLEGE